MRLVSYTCDKCGVVVQIPPQSKADEHLRDAGWAITASKNAADGKGHHFCGNCRIRKAYGPKTPSSTMTMARDALASLDGVLDPLHLEALVKAVNRGQHKAGLREVKRMDPKAPRKLDTLPAPPRKPRTPADVDRHEVAGALGKLNHLQLSTFCQAIRKMRGAPDDVGLPLNGRDASYQTLLNHAKNEASTTDRTKPGSAAGLLISAYGAKFPV